MFGSKYFSKKVTIDGMKFDSTGEYHYWQYLKDLESKSEIFNLERQIPIEIIPRIDDKDGRCIFRATHYKADFTYDDKAGIHHVVDFKGYETPEFKLKRKLLLYVAHINLEIVDRDDLKGTPFEIKINKKKKLNDGTTD